MLEGVNFSYDGVKSVDMGLINCRVEGGMFSEAFLSSSTIEETKVRGNDKPYYQGKTRDPLTFDLTFAFINGYDSDKIREVARWLDADYYKPFYTTDNPNRIFYCMLDSEPNLLHNGLKQGYISLTMRCDSPYSYTPVYNKENLDFTNSEDISSINDDNYSISNGTKSSLIVNENNNLVIEHNEPAWEYFGNKTWGDI